MNLQARLFVSVYLLLVFFTNVEPPKGNIKDTVAYSQRSYHSRIQKDLQVPIAMGCSMLQLDQPVLATLPLFVPKHT